MGPSVRHRPCCRAPSSALDLVLTSPQPSVESLDLESTRATREHPAGKPIQVALISNPTSGRNERHGLLAGVHDLLRTHPTVAHAEERSYEGIVRATRAAMSEDTGVIAVNGGDGTVQAVLTSMLSAPAGPLPVVAVLAGGTTNTTARNVGYGEAPLAALERVLTASARGVLAGSVERHRVLRADFEGSSQYGMMFGAGAVYHGIVFARDQLAARGVRGQFGAGLALATFLMKAIRRQDSPLSRPLEAGVIADGVPLPQESYVGMLASTMDRQFLGLNPYWGVGPGSMRFSAMRHPPRHLARALVPILRGRSSRWLDPEFGYRSLNADEVTIEFAGGFTLDGELFAPARRARRVALTARQSAYFLRAPG